MPKTRLSVLIGDDYLDRMPLVLGRLRAAGLEVDQVLDAVGTVSGSIDAGQIASLEQVEGVSAVERSRDFQLPPPDADVQ